MSDKAHIVFENVSLYYYTFDQGINSVKDYVLKLGFAKPFVKRKVLEQVSFEVKPGEVVGILGKNGTGKSSLLKCVAGILKSYTGKVEVDGRIAPMLAIGAGIEMELTGMENIKLITSLMGVPATREKIDEIIAFSELSVEDLKRQVKTYSTGMISRLSFSIAVSEDPDILLVDEVLAVGDSGFQEKCMKRINDIKESGSTILFVSHSPDDVRNICTRTICIDHGRIVFDGQVEEGLDIYKQQF